MSMLSVSVQGTNLQYDPETLLFSVSRDGTTWQTSAPPAIQFSRPTGEARANPWEPIPSEIESIPLTAAKTKETASWKTGLGKGFITRFSGIPGTDLTFETLLWIDNSRGELFAELIPHEDPKDQWHTVVFPASFAFDEPGTENYTLINMRQGLMLPNGHPVDHEPITYGQYFSAAAYMPWFGQVRGSAAYIAIGLTP